MNKNYRYKALITNIVDGDTMDAEVDLGFRIKIKIRFRINGIDTPEIYHPSCPEEKEHGIKATERAKQLLLGKSVNIVSHKPDKFGRWLCDILLDESRTYTELMILEGYLKKDSYI